MRPIRFLAEAEEEMNDAALWYEKRQADLGKRLLASIQDSLNRISISPLSCPIVEGDVRRCLTRTFPFAVLYRVQEDEITVIAVMHLRRDPGYWRERTTDTE